MKARVQEIADELANEMATNERSTDGATTNEPVDLVASFAYKLPLFVILEIMGVPRSDAAQIHNWANAIGANRGGVVPENIEPAYHAFVAFQAYVDGQVARLEANPDGNLLSILLDAQHEGRLTADELSSNVINILFAGHETTTNLIANGTFSLLTHHDQWNRLTTVPDLVPGSIEELLRFEPPVQFNARISAEDTELAGVPIPKDTQVIAMLAAGNHDPNRFENPETLDITREDNDHISFGFGAHYCLGTFLARVEGDVAISTLVKRFPNMALTSREPQWRPNRNLRGLAALPVRLHG